MEIVDNMAGKPIVKGQSRRTLKYDFEFQQHTAKFLVQVGQLQLHQRMGETGGLPGATMAAGL